MCAHFRVLAQITLTPALCAAPLYSPRYTSLGAALGSSEFDVLAADADDDDEWTGPSALLSPPTNSSLRAFNVGNLSALLPATPLALSPLLNANSTPAHLGVAADDDALSGSPGLVVSTVVFPRPGIYVIAAMLDGKTLPASPALIAVRPGAPVPHLTDILTSGAARAGAPAAAMLIPRDASGSRTGRSLDVATWRVELVESGSGNGSAGAVTTTTMTTTLTAHPLLSAPGVFAVPFSPTLAGDAEIRVSSYDVGGGLRAAVWGGGSEGSLLSRSAPDDEWDSIDGALLEGVDSQALNGGGDGGLGSSQRVVRAWASGGVGARVAWGGYAFVDKSVARGSDDGGRDAPSFFVGMCVAGGQARFLTDASVSGEGAPPPRAAGDALARSLVNGSFYDVDGVGAGVYPRVPPGWTEIVRAGVRGSSLTIGGSVAPATAAAWCPGAGAGLGGVSVVWSHAPVIRASVYTGVFISFDAADGVASSGSLCSGAAGCALSLALAPADPRTGAVDVTRAVPFPGAAFTPPSPAAIGVARSRLTILPGAALGSTSTVRFTQPSAPRLAAGAAAAAWVDGAGGDAAAVRAARAAADLGATAFPPSAPPPTGAAIIDAAGRAYAAVAVRGWPLHVHVAVRDALGNLRAPVADGGRVTDATAAPTVPSKIAAAFETASAAGDTVVVWATAADDGGGAVLPPAAFKIEFAAGVWTASAEVPDDEMRAGATSLLVHVAVNPPFPVGAGGAAGGDVLGWARLAAAAGAYASGAPFLVASLPRAPSSADTATTAPTTTATAATAGTTQAAVRSRLLDHLDAALSTPLGIGAGGWAASLAFASSQTRAPASASPLGASRPTLTRDARLFAGTARGGGGGGDVSGFWSAGAAVNVTVSLWQYGSRDGVSGALDTATPARLAPCPAEEGGGLAAAATVAHGWGDGDAAASPLYAGVDDARHVPLLSAAQRRSLSGDAVVAACNDTALAVLWIEPPPGLVDGRAGGAWDETLAFAGASSSEAARPPLVAFTAPLTRVDADGDGATALMTRVTARAPGTYVFGVFIGGALVGAPFSIAVFPAPPSAAASELLAARHLCVTPLRILC